MQTVIINLPIEHMKLNNLYQEGFAANSKHWNICVCLGSAGQGSLVKKVKRGLTIHLYASDKCYWFKLFVSSGGTTR